MKAKGCTELSDQLVESETNKSLSIEVDCVDGEELRADGAVAQTSQGLAGATGCPFSTKKFFGDQNFVKFLPKIHDIAFQKS